MNKTIYSSSLKKSIGFLAIIIIFTVCTILSLIMLFPSVSSGGSSYADFLKSMPREMLTAIGMNGNVSNLNEYLNMNFYNSIYLYILMAFVIIFTTKLIAKPIEDTSLVYYLNSSISRKKFLFSQVLVFITGLALICAFSIVFTIIGKKIFISGYAFNIVDFVKCNLVTGCIFLFLGSISILISATSKTTNKAMTYSSAIIIGQYIFDMLGKVSVNINWMKYINIFTVYDPTKIIKDTTYLYSRCGVLIAVSIVLIVISGELFKKRDLYL